MNINNLTRRRHTDNRYETTGTGVVIMSRIAIPAVESATGTTALDFPAVG
jgi:hypothetical protein